MQTWNERKGNKGGLLRGAVEEYRHIQDAGDRAWADAEHCRAVISRPVASKKSDDLEDEQNPS